MILPENLSKERSPWTGRRSKSETLRPDPSVVSREYSQGVKKEDYDRNILAVQREALIESILDLDRTKIEYIRRLVIEDRRLDILMTILGYRTPPHQMVLWKFIENRRVGLIMAPRGSGKSTSCNICANILDALVNPNIRILIASRAESAAVAFLSEIKGNFYKPQFLEIFGNLKGNKWDETRCDVIGRTKHTKEHTFTVAGADGAITSGHYDKILLDDIVDDKNSRTEPQRDHIRRFFNRTLLPTLEPDGKLHVLGTRYDKDDLLGQLSENSEMFKDNVFVLPAVFDENTLEPVELVQNDKGKFVAPPGAMSWDEEGFPMKELLKRRQEMTVTDWELQYENRASEAQGDYFNIEMFKYFDCDDVHEVVHRLGLVTWCGVDLASSQKDSADEFAIVTIGVVPRKFDLYVLDTFSGRFTFTQQLDALKKTFDKYNPMRMFVEANSYQAMLESTAVEIWPEIRTIPIWTTKDKVTRMRSIQIYYERGQVYHRKSRCAKLEGQLVGFPKKKLKDLCDALYFAVNGALMNAAKKKRTVDPGLNWGAR